MPAAAVKKRPAMKRPATRAAQAKVVEQIICRMPETPSLIVDNSACATVACGGIGAGTLLETGAREEIRVTRRWLVMENGLGLEPGSPARETYA